MRLLRLQDDAPDGALLELHPRMSVVSGLYGPSRDRLLDALASLPGGRGIDGLNGVSGLVESTGILLDLDPATLALLDLTSDLDPVVRENDLNQLGDGPLGTATSAPAAVSLDEARQAQRNITATHDVLRASLDSLQEEHRRVLARRSVLASALAGLGGAPPSAAARTERVAVEQDDDRVRTTTRSTTVVLDGPGPTPEAVAALASAAARVDRLRTRRDETLAALAPFEDIDTSDVEAALAETQQVGPGDHRPDPGSVALADQLAAAVAALDAYDVALEAAGQGPVAAYRRLDEAQRWFLAADAAVKPPVIDPEEARALEAAQDELQAAEQKLTAARMPGKNLKKRLDDAVEAQQQVLARMGFATYASFVMSTTAPTVSPELRARHEEAQVAFVEAEAAFMEAGAALERDPERNALMGAVEQARHAARELLGPVHDTELEPMLRERTLVDDAHLAEADGVAGRLRAALQAAGVDFGDLELEPEEVAEVAAVWLADMGDAATQRAELEAELGSIEDEIGMAELELADVDTAAPSLLQLLDEDQPSENGAEPSDDLLDDAWDDPPWSPTGDDTDGERGDVTGESHGDEDDAGDDLDDGTRADLEEALAEVDAEAADLEEQIDAQGALVAATAAGVQGATAQVATLEAAEYQDTAWDGELAAAGLDGTPDEAGDVGGLAQVEWYLLARLAAERSVSYAGSVPLVLDDALVRLADDEVEYLLERLLRMTDAVQVIYLGDDPRVIEWGRAAGEQVGLVPVG